MKTILFNRLQSSHISTLNNLRRYGGEITDTHHKTLVYESKIFGSQEAISLLRVLHEKLSRDDYVSAVVEHDAIYFYKKIPGELSVLKYVYSDYDKRWNPEV